MATLGVTESTFTMAEVLDAVEANGSRDEFSEKRISKEGLHAALVARIVYRTEEAAWNLAHNLTATCPECGGAMKDDDRITCTFKCHQARSRRIDPYDPEFANMDNHPKELQ